MNSPVVLITGALTGIGRATAIAFAKQGATVVISGRRETEGRSLEAELGSLGRPNASDLTDLSGVTQSLELLCLFGYLPALARSMPLPSWWITG